MLQSQSACFGCRIMHVFAFKQRSCHWELHPLTSLCLRYDSRDERTSRIERVRERERVDGVSPWEEGQDYTHSHSLRFTPWPDLEQNACEERLQTNMTNMHVLMFKSDRLLDLHFLKDRKNSVASFLVLGFSLVDSQTFLSLKQYGPLAMPRS